MRRHRLAAAVVVAAAALLLAPAAGQAQVGMGSSYYAGAPAAPYYGWAPSDPGALSWPGAFSYTQRYVWYGYNWPYRGYYSHHYHDVPYFPSGGPPTPTGSVRSAEYEEERALRYGYGALSGSEGGTARVKVTLPSADAEVWFEGQLTRQRGTQRGFVSPALEPGREYVYDVRARWTENGREVERSRTVRVRADGVARVDFTAQ
jgi:uncharacterized protein (TIGR03000 family)